MFPHFPILGFTGDTPILTADGPKSIEDIKPGDIIQVQPGDGQATTRRTPTMIMPTTMIARGSATDAAGFSARRSPRSTPTPRMTPAKKTQTATVSYHR
jgi:hypothetical protein